MLIDHKGDTANEPTACCSLYDSFLLIYCQLGARGFNSSCGSGRDAATVLLAMPIPVASETLLSRATFAGAFDPGSFDVGHNGERIPQRTDSRAPSWMRLDPR